MGPTNSGKTHAALERLAEARAGLYCGPLRVLAAEVFCRMNARGVPCELLTGQEHRRSFAAATDAAEVGTDSGPRADDADTALTRDPRRTRRLVDPVSVWHPPPPSLHGGGNTGPSSDGGDAPPWGSILANHLACTVEMAPTGDSSPTARADVAPGSVLVIDEGQMIGDRERGWAWTRALVSCPADEVHVTGDGTSADVIARIADLCGDPAPEIVRYERLAPLVVARKAVGGARKDRGGASQHFAHSLRDGDCVVGFSRRVLHGLRTELARLRPDLAVSMLYGALPPETRLLQADSFNRGGVADTENIRDRPQSRPNHHRAEPVRSGRVLLATDAVGLGVNLNMGRVVFSSLRKFDGVVERTLTASEVRQIAGRAGRFGSGRGGAGGIVTCVEPRDMALLRSKMSEPPIPVAAARVSPEIDDALAAASLLYGFDVEPTDPCFGDAFSDLSGGDGTALPRPRDLSLARVLMEIEATADNIVSPPFALADIGERIEAALELDTLGLTFDQCWSLSQCPAPEGTLRAIGTLLAEHSVVRLEDVMSERAARIADAYVESGPAGPDASAHDGRGRGLDIMERGFGVADAYVWLSRRRSMALSFPDAEDAERTCVALAEGIHDTIETPLLAFTPRSRGRRTHGHRRRQRRRQRRGRR